MLKVLGFQLLEHLESTSLSTVWFQLPNLRHYSEAALNAMSDELRAKFLAKINSIATAGFTCPR